MAKIQLLLEQILVSELGRSGLLMEIFIPAHCWGTHQRVQANIAGQMVAPMRVSGGEG
jgi:hypothetical protein